MSLPKDFLVRKSEYKTNFNFNKIERIFTNPKFKSNFEIRIDRTDCGKYRITPNISFGVGISLYFTKPIQIFVELSNLEDKKGYTTVIISTITRWELTIALPLLFIFLFLNALYQKNVIQIYLLVFVFLVTFLIFRALYKSQEKFIIKSLIKVLKLIKTS